MLSGAESATGRSVSATPLHRAEAMQPGSRRRSARRTYLLPLDAVAVAAAASLGPRWEGAVLATAAMLAALGTAGLYRARLHISALDDAAHIITAIGLAWAVLGWVGPPLPVPAGVPAARFWWWLVLAAAVVLARALGHAVMRRIKGDAAVPTVVIGAGPVGVRIADALKAHPECGLHPIGFVGTHEPTATSVLPLPVLGPLEALTDVVEQHQVESVIVTFLDLGAEAELVDTLRQCRQHGTAVLVVPRLFQMDVGCIHAEVIGGVPLVRMRALGRQRWEWRLKRAMDIAGAVVGLVLLSPVMLACALAVRREVGRAGVFFRQERVGPDGIRFDMLKFRSLTPSSATESGHRWDISADPRVGPVGRFLRRSSLDELPQLVNVLRGDMSLVGPRPERPFFVEKFGRQHRDYLHRHRVPGGMTGWSQVHDLRGDTSIDERAAYDNYYIENWSLGLDLKILLRTVGVVLIPPLRRRPAPSSPPVSSDEARAAS